jgi:hypothetical protein
VDGAPAGQPHSPDVLWHEESVFIRDGRLARSFEALVAELARPFVNEAVTEAIKACIERDDGFIAEYMEEHFTLEAACGRPPRPRNAGGDGTTSTTHRFLSPPSLFEGVLPRFYPKLLSLSCAGGPPSPV